MKPDSPRLNLLGRRQVQQMARRQRLIKQASVVVLAGAALAGVAVWWQYRQLLELRELHERQAQALAAEDKRLADAASIRQSLQVLAKRQANLQALSQQQRAGAQGLLELARHFPPGLRLTQWQQEADTLVVTGTATSAERLNELMAAGSASGRVWSAPELVSLTAVPSDRPLSPSDSSGALLPVLSFSLRLSRQLVAP